MQLHGVGGWVFGAVAVLAIACDAEEGRPDAGWSGPEGGEQRVHHGTFVVGDHFEDIDYEVVDGYAVHQGDMVLGRVDDLTAWERGEDVELAATAPDNRWPGGVVPYAIDPAIDETSEAVFLEALGDMHAFTNVLFVERTDEKNYIIVTSDDDRCAATLGFRDRGPQYFNLGPRCQRKGTALHELSHVVGLFHEQSRADRDDHVEILLENVRDEKLEHNFRSYEHTGEGEDVGPYDFDSIMHYSPTAFGIETDEGRMTTIVALDGRTDFGQRERLSAGDIGGIASLYGPRNAPAECAVVLQPGEWLSRGDSHASCDGRFSVSLREDGDFVVTQGSKVLGSVLNEGSVSEGPQFFVMFDSGTFGLFRNETDKSGREVAKRLWGARTESPQSYLVLDDRGELSVRSPAGTVLWSSGTAVE